MIRKILSYAAPPLIAAAALMASPAEALAQRGGGHVGGGFRGGRSYGGHHGVRPGVVGGYHPYYGGHYYNGYGYHPYYYGYHYRPFYGSGLGFYPYYGYGLYPSYSYGYNPYSYQSYESYPSTSYYSAIDPNLGSMPASDTTPTITTAGAGNATPGGQTGSDSSPTLFSANQPVHITVRLPADAELWFEGKKMGTTGSVRKFTSPALTPGRQYTYTIRARWAENGTATEQTRTVAFEPGNDLEVNFPVPDGTGERARGMTLP